MENTISNANKYAMSRPTHPVLSWQEIMVQYAEEYNSELLKQRDELIKCLKVFISFAKNGHIPDEETYFEAKDLLTKHQTK